MCTTATERKQRSLCESELIGMNVNAETGMPEEDELLLALFRTCNKDAKSLFAALIKAVVGYQANHSLNVVQRESLAEFVGRYTDPSVDIDVDDVEQELLNALHPEQ